MAELPKLPRGMGGYDYYKDGIRFKKRIRYEDMYKDVAVYGKTISEVNAKMAEKEAEFIKNSKKEYVKPSARLLQDSMEQWMIRYKQTSVKRTTYDRLESTFEHHIKDCDIGLMQEKAIDSDDLQDYINKKASSKLSHSSVKKIYELMSQYFKYKYTSCPNENPMLIVNLPKKEEIIKDEELIIWDDAEMKLLTDLAKEEYHDRVSGYQYGLLVTFLMWSFVRIGELAALKWEDIDFANGTLNINKQFSYVKDRKNNCHERIVTKPKYSSIRKIVLPKPALECIQLYKERLGYSPSVSNFILSDEDGEVFNELRVRRTYERMVKELGFTKPVTVHGLRHSGISYLLRHGVPVEVVSRMAGHSSISITLETYYSVIEQQKTDAMDEFNSKFSFE